MKKVTVFALLSLFSLSVFSQNHKAVFGVNTGMNMTTLIGEYPFQSKSQALTNFTYSVYGQLNFSEMFSLVINPGIERKGSLEKGARIFENGDPKIADVQINYNYVSVPVLARFSFGDQIQFFGNAGIYMAILTKSTYKYNDQEYDVSNYNFYDSGLTGFGYRGVPPVDFGLSFGAGVNVPLAELIYLTFEIRNNLGLLNVSPGDTYNNGPPIPFENGAVNNSTCFLFGFGIGI